MNFRKTILVLAMTASVFTGVAQASVERRYDFNCQFSNNGKSCEAWASIYTRRQLEVDSLEPSEEGGPSAQWRSMERMAIFCEQYGVIYANDADSHFRQGELHIVAEGRHRPEIEIQLPLNGGQVSAELELSRHLRLMGSCSYSSHSID